jgi:hypothetical protein
VSAVALSTVPSVVAAWSFQALFDGPQMIETPLTIFLFWITYLGVLVVFRRHLVARILDLSLSAIAGRSKRASRLGVARQES